MGLIISTALGDPDFQSAFFQKTNLGGRPACCLPGAGAMNLAKPKSASVSNAFMPAMNEWASAQPPTFDITVRLEDR